MYELDAYTTVRAIDALLDTIPDTDENYAERLKLERVRERYEDRRLREHYEHVHQMRYERDEYDLY